MFKDDVLAERKDRERAQAQREKMRRDLEVLQARVQSLQEQVYVQMYTPLSIFYNMFTWIVFSLFYYDFN